MTAPTPGRVRAVTWWLADWWYATVWQVRSLGPTTADDYRSGDREPVVVVPGIYETWHFLRPLMEALHDRGHPVYVVTALRHNQRPVVDGARTVMEIVESEDLRDVVVLAHSKGGLIGKYAMTHLDADGRLDRMIAISSPFGGSVLARFGLLPSLRAFRATDPTLAGLIREVAANSRITSIYGVVDTLIPNGSELVGATNVQLPVGGHFRILGDRATRSAVVVAVDGPGVRAPGGPHRRGR